MKKIDSKVLDQTLEISVGSFYLYDGESTGIEMYSGSLSSHSIDRSIEDGTPAIGGKDGAELYVIPGKSSTEITVVDVINNQSLENLKMTGDVAKVVGSQSGIYSFHEPTNYTVAETSGAKKITLSKIPMPGEIVAVYKTKGEKTMIDPTKVIVEGGVVTISDAEVLPNDTVFVTGFKYIPSEKALRSVIKADATPPTFLCVIKVPVFNLDMVHILDKTYIFPKVQMNTTTSSKGQSEKQVVAAETKLKVLKSATEELGYILYEPVV